MGIRGRLAESMIRSQGREKALPVIMKLLGFDEEVWRTSEEGKHFKLETSTGEIKAGFGGKLNGRKIGETFTPNHAEKAAGAGNKPAEKANHGHNGASAEKQPASKWQAELSRKKGIAMAWKPEMQAEFLYRQGFLDEDAAVAAMENGTAAEQMEKYFDIQEKNGDPTPTKPIRKAPDINQEVREGKHVPPEDQMWPSDPYTQARMDYIQEWTGMDHAEARDTFDELRTWFGGSWDKADTDILDKYIEKDGAYGGEIFRGMSFDEGEYASFMKNVQPGSKIGMIGNNSSWADNKEQAWHFSKGGDRHVILHCVKNKTAAPVDHLSIHGENEILAHSRTQWTVIGVKEGDSRTEITVIEAGEYMSKEERDHLKKTHGNDALPEKHDEPVSLAQRMKEQNKFIQVVPPEQDSVLQDSDERSEACRKMDEIALTWLKMRNAGVGEKALQSYYDESGFAELSEKARQR